MVRFVLAALLLALPTGLMAEEIIADMSQTRVSITANFDGSEILIYGAVRREAARPPGALGVIIAVEGPSEPVTVRRKDKRVGIWVNTEALKVDLAPTFYAVTTSAPLPEVLSETENLRYRISIPSVIRAVGVADTVGNVDAFLDALIRVRTKNDLYQLNEGAVRITGETLFDTSIELPSNLTQGAYRTRIFLTRDGVVVDEYETQIEVSKVGLEKFLYNLAHEKPLIYGLLSLAIAIAAGWMAAAFFRYIRG